MGVALSKLPDDASDVEEVSPFDQLIQPFLVDHPYDLEFFQTFMTINKRYRRMGVDVLKTKVRLAVERFVPFNHVDDFFIMLQKRRSVIGGSIAQSVVSPSYFINHPPTDLNIFCPTYASDRWVVFFRQLGFQISVDSVVGYARKPVESRYVARMPGSDLTIAIIVSKGYSALVPVFSSVYTTQMNFISGSHIFSAFPKFTLHGTTMKRAHSVDENHSEKLQLRGITVFEPRNLTGPCPVYCSMELRRTWTGRGIARVPWQEEEGKYRKGLAFLQKNSVSFVLSFWTSAISASNLYRDVGASLFAFPTGKSPTKHSVSPFISSDLVCLSPTTIAHTSSLVDIGSTGVRAYVLRAKRIAVDLVFIPALHGVSAPLSLNDLDYSIWFPTTAFPWDSQVKLYEAFTVVWGRDRIQNSTVNSFSGGVLSAWRGDIFVVKHGFNGKLTDVSVEDKFFAIRLVLQCASSPL
ncbi:hypothetical protein CVT26_009609 [Gymnopilus dilepis]|uniref:Uncharacterized protein n=1 Tax=Gymnopilus dilepis TaxID=231916 RepID=A0A409YIH0_9AGAR|nr:hypothetical protein CVT26_009609 [Gymnopilus dilepis]